MTDRNKRDQTALLKTDVLGRVRTTRQQREVILDAYESGSLSGPEFARVHGINYQTFATWRQKRKRRRSEYPPEPPQLALSHAPAFTLIEAELPPMITPRKAGLQIQSGTLRVNLSDTGQIPLAVEFLKHWEKEQKPC